MIINPTPGMRLKLRTGETIEVVDVNQSFITIRGPHDPPVRHWVRVMWNIYTLDAERLPAESV